MISRSLIGRMAAQGCSIDTIGTPEPSSLTSSEHFFSTKSTENGHIVPLHWVRELPPQRVAASEGQAVGAQRQLKLVHLTHLAVGDEHTSGALAVADRADAEA